MFVFILRELVNTIFIFFIYVDDLFLASDSDLLISSFKEKISSQFNIVDLGKATHFLGMEISYNEKCKVMMASQANFICKVTKRFGLKNSKPIYYTN